MIDLCFWRLSATLAAAAVFLTSCASGFEKFYTPAPPNALAAVATLPPPETPQLFAHSDDLQSDGKRLREQGFIFIGSSSFYGPANRSNAQQAVAQGKKVGAAIVMVKSQYMDTLTGVVPFTTTGPPQVATVNTSGTVNTYGSGGYATGTFDSTGTVTMPGATTTNYLPYSIPRNTFYASYWAKGDPNKMRLGAYWVPLSDDLRHRLQRNTGVVINIVVNGTPAFRANVLEGDIVEKINNEDVIDVAGFRDQLRQFAGQQVNLTVARGDEKKILTLTLNPP
jgi:hypothetical protein